MRLITTTMGIRTEPAAVRVAVLAGAVPTVISKLAVADDLAVGRLAQLETPELDLRRSLRVIWDGTKTPPAGAARDLTAHILSPSPPVLAGPGSAARRWLSGLDDGYRIRQHIAHGSGLSPSKDQDARVRSWITPPRAIAGGCLAATARSGPTCGRSLCWARRPASVP
jgi:hypothetical protein